VSRHATSREAAADSGGIGREPSTITKTGCDPGGIRDLRRPSRSSQRLVATGGDPRRGLFSGRLRRGFRGNYAGDRRKIFYYAKTGRLERNNGLQ